jgi:hypothetical protein
MNDRQETKTLAVDDIIATVEKRILQVEAQRDLAIALGLEIKKELIKAKTRIAELERQLQ